MPTLIHTSSALLAAAGAAGASPAFCLLGGARASLQHSRAVSPSSSADRTTPGASGLPSVGQTAAAKRAATLHQCWHAAGGTGSGPAAPSPVPPSDGRPM
eukprot:366057-Chlamydomonas_euryale.AAC.6